MDISIHETFLNNVSTIYIDFSTTDNFNTEVCVQYFKISSNYETSVYLQCVDTSSGYVATPISINRSNSYIARVYQLHNGIKYQLEEYSYPEINSFGQKTLDNGFDKAIVLFLWVVIIVFGLVSKNIMITFILSLFLSWGELSIFPETMSISGSVLKTVIAILLIIISRKKEDSV